METMHLAFCCDDDYAQHLGAALCSALSHLSKSTLADVFVICSKFSSDNKKKIQAVGKKHGTDVRFIEVVEEHFTGLKTTHYVSHATYFRIALPDLLPKEIEKVLYLDSDLIVLDDLAKLWNIDIKKTYLAAVPEGDQKNPYIYRDKIDMPPEALYFNAGVLIINLEKWRLENMSKKLFDYIRDNPHKISWWDQDALNAFFYDSFIPLSRRWNFVPAYMDESNTYCLNFDKNDIGIVHFLGGNIRKPWHPASTHPLKSEYYKHLKKTPWKHFRPLDPNPRQKLLAKCIRPIKKILRTVRAIISYAGKRSRLNLLLL